MKLYILILSSLAVGCGTDPGEQDSDNTNGGGTGGCESAITIADIQQAEEMEKEEVQIDCAIVTSELTAEGDGFFVQDPGGGPWSGMYIYLYSTVEDLEVEIGDEVTIVGTVTEYYDFTEISVATAYDVQITGSGEVTTDELACDETDMEQWESCLVSVPGIEMVGYPDSYGETETTCNVDLNDMFYDYGGADGSACDAITGLVEYNYKEWKLNPRDDDDKDNCSAGNPPQDRTIADIRQNGFEEGDYVTLSGVVATSGLTYDEALFFVQDEGGGPNSGLAVYIGSDSFDVEPGAMLDITGSLTDYYGLLEITPTAIDDLGTTTAAVATSLDSAPKDWEVYESALITLQDVEITSKPDGYNEVETNYDINIDDLFYDHDLQPGQSFSSVTGPLYYGYEAYKICPREAADLVP